ncbi:hypothetical protein [Epilithonimonas mollis]|uniref:HTH araC/xylS-type domain-containing protein n=1 Tax=Epilithonimonas mollis TaxID=216903 RepID=A0A1M6UQM7_9FLAO|nr:hypothetical protein [Epilithonimonas mollis]SHK71498.1 hypothetical protein SAMN05444371_3421 [Epilithonimonas mollis]
MSYNRKNYLARVIEIQNIVLEKKNEDLFLKNIYWEQIEPKYKISQRTFQSYLGINAKKQLKELNTKQNE